MYPMTESGAPNRPLADSERKIVDAMLDQGFEGVSELRMQARSAVVSSESPAFLDLAVDRCAPRSTLGGGPIPVRLLVKTDGEYSSEVLLWVEDGYLSLLEHAWFTDEMPATFPDLSSQQTEIRYPPD